MARKQKPLPLLQQVTIADVAAEGKALAKVDDMVVFTQYAVPGDVVDIQIFKKKKNYAEGRVVQFHHLSDKRCEAKCAHYGVCGGCKWQILPYDEQLRYKQQQVVDNLTRLGHIDLPQVQPIIGSKKIYEYRNKLEFTFSNRRWLTTEQLGEAADIERNDVGFHIPNMFDKVLDIDRC